MPRSRNISPRTRPFRIARRAPRATLLLHHTHRPVASATSPLLPIAGNFSLRGNDIRFVLRPPGGEILNSTYFSVETSQASNGSLGKLTIRGNGYGHGVGMCQWGAIGRARAGQDVRTILRTYYPGTTIGAAE